MKKLQAFCLRAASLQGLLAVACGAFGAHGLGDWLAGVPSDQVSMRLDWVATGSRYQLIHAVALLAMTALIPRLAERKALWIARCFFYGPLIFSLSLYAMALGAPIWLGAVTPVGGVLMLAGWGLLYVAWAGDVPVGLA